MSRFIARFLARAISQTLPHLAIFAVMMLAFASGTTSSWQCEGQTCGATAWTCCCTQPTAQSWAECDAAPHFTRGDHAVETGGCPVDCHCTMTVQDNGPSLASAHFSLAFPSVFVLPTQFAPSFEAPNGSDSPRPLVSRGPPIQSVTFASVSLRGPPVA